MNSELPKDVQEKRAVCVGSMENRGDLLTDQVSTGIFIDRTNPTSARIEQAIAENGGSIPYTEFMGQSLFGSDGYYSAAHARIRGQFVTCPELSEEFNFSLGEATRKVWEGMGKPDNFKVIEMGAGNGTLAKDMLVWARETQPDLYAALRYTIVEYGDFVEKQQQMIGGNSRRLHKRSGASTVEQHNADLQKVRWLRDSAIAVDLGEVGGVFISNELPDTFPVEVIRAKDGRLQQKYITLENDEWVEVWANPVDEVFDYVNSFGLVVAEGCQEPININAVKWQQNLSRSLKKGAIITIDFGQAGPCNAVEATRTFPQQKGSEYNYPGRVDITSDINFRVLRRVAEKSGLQTAFLDTQARFLHANGYPTLEELESKLSGSALYNAKRVLRVFGDACKVLVSTRGI
jgi:SAM-dependent MidA family methyltransferase